MGATAFAADSPELRLKQLGAGLRPTCRERLREPSELKLLLAAPGLEELLSAKPNALAAKPEADALRKTLAGWSSDLLIAVALQIEQEIGSCTKLTPTLTRVVAELQRAYLEKVGVRAKPAERAAAFRIFLSLKGDVEPLTKAVAAAPPGSPRKTAVLVYGNVGEVRGVPVLGGTPVLVRALAAFVTEVCGKDACPFFEPLTVTKVVLRKEDGLAAYVPETGVLVLSEALLGKRNRLHDIVLLHELAHVAERGAWLRDRKRWANEFLPFSAAEPKTLAPSRDDELTALSAEDAFSLLPDPVLAGFVTAKSYRDSKERQDVSEDIADHIAVFRFLPERYCHGKAPLAPEKWRWVRTNVFPKRTPPKLSCEPG